MMRPLNPGSERRVRRPITSVLLQARLNRPELPRPLLIAPISDPNQIAAIGAGRARIEHSCVGSLMPHVYIAVPSPSFVALFQRFPVGQHGVEFLQAFP